MVSASDCGSEGRGFESHYPPHKINPIHTDGVYFMHGAIAGFERPLRKHAGGMFLGRGRIPFFPDALLSECGREEVSINFSKNENVNESHYPVDFTGGHFVSPEENPVLFVHTALSAELWVLARNDSFGDFDLLTKPNRHTEIQLYFVIVANLYIII